MGALALICLLSAVTADRSSAEDVVVDDFVYEEFNSVLRLKGYTGTSADLTVPSEVTISGKLWKVTTVLSTAFAGNQTVKSIILNEGIKELSPRSFENCTSLKTVQLPTTVISVGESAFKGCTSLESINIPRIITLSGSVFENCASLKTVSLPTSISFIRDSAFKGCSSLTEISIRSSVTLGASAFEGCSKLASVYIQNTDSIPWNCFKNCSSLVSITLPENVKDIRDYAFYGCLSLENMILLNEALSDDMVKGEHALSLGTSSSQQVICKIDSVAYTKGLFHPEQFTMSEDGEKYTQFQYNLTKFTLTVDCAGVTYVSSLTAGSVPSVTKGDITVPLKDFIPEREGYTFAGWDISVPEYMPAKDLSLKAKWTANKYTVTFMPGESGIGDPYIQIFDYDTMKSLLENTFFSETGLFACWAYDGGTYSDRQLVRITKDTMLTAQWDLAKYQITYDKGEGTGSMYATPFNGGDVTLSKNTFTRTGYLFGGWSDGISSYTDGQTCYFTSSVKLSAIWNPITYTVMFDLNGGSGSGVSLTATYDVPFLVPGVETSRIGYKFFDVWVFMSGSSTKEYNKGDSVKNLTTTQGSTVSLYAKWVPNTYHLCFNPNAEGVEGEMSVQDVSYGQVVKINPVAYTKKFYDFKGWALTPTGTEGYTDGQEIYNLTDEDGKDIQLYAVWEVGQYHIIYDPGDGDGDLMDFPWVTYFEKYTIPECTYTYGDHVFKGWLSELDDRIYQPGDVVENLSDGYSQIILTAQWSSDDSSSMMLIIGSVLGLVAICVVAFMILRRHS